MPEIAQEIPNILHRNARNIFSSHSGRQVGGTRSALTARRCGTGKECRVHDTSPGECTTVDKVDAVARAAQSVEPVAPAQPVQVQSTAAPWCM